MLRWRGLIPGLHQPHITTIIFPRDLGETQFCFDAERFGKPPLHEISYILGAFGMVVGWE
jgi:hypothetical protein